MDLADQDLIAVTARLRSVLAAARGKLRGVDALALAGFEERSPRRLILVGRAMRELGWKRGRYRFDGELLSAFAKGSFLEREVILDVAPGEGGQLVVKGRAP